MRVFFLLMVLIGSQLSFAGLARATDAAFPQSPIVGKWAYFMKVFDGQEMPEPPSATLRLRFEFTAGGISHLYWWHEGDSDLCERRGRYHIEGDLLVDKVEWVNPKNAYGCSSDPDMQNGKTTRTPIYFEGGNFVMRLHLGDEELLYVWRRMKEGEI